MITHEDKSGYHVTFPWEEWPSSQVVASLVVVSLAEGEAKRMRHLYPTGCTTTTAGTLPWSAMASGRPCHSGKKSRRLTHKALCLATDLGDLSRVTWVGSQCVA